MALEGSEAGKIDGVEEPKIYTKKEVQTFIAEISQRVLEPNTSHLHSVLAINHLLRQSNMPELLDGDLRDQLKDLWIKLKSTGVQLNDPPLLFTPTPSGMPSADS